MRKGMTSALHIGLSRTGATMLHTHGLWRRCTEVVAETALSGEDLSCAEHLSARLGQLFADIDCARLPVSVILADELVRLFMVTPPGNATRLQDCRSAAEVRFRSLYGDAPAGWQLQADWDAATPFLASATPAYMMSALMHLVKDHGLACIEIAPRFVADWNQWRHVLLDDAWFGVAQGSQLTLGVVSKRQLVAVRMTTVPEGWTEVDWLPDYLGREALRLNLPVPQQLLVCGNVPGHWITQDFGSLICMRVDAAQRAQMDVTWSREAALAYGGVKR